MSHLSSTTPFSTPSNMARSKESAKESAIEEGASEQPSGEKGTIEIDDEEEEPDSGSESDDSCLVKRPKISRMVSQLQN